MDAIAGLPFMGTFRLPPTETADTATATLLRHDDSEVETGITMTKVDGGYLISHTFSTEGTYKLKVEGGSGTEYFASLNVIGEFPTKEEVENIRDAILDTQVVVKEKYVYIKQLLTANFVAGGPVGFAFGFTPNANATPDEQSQLSGTWDQGVNKHFDSGSFDTSAVVGSIVTYTNGVFSIIATNDPNDMSSNQNQNDDYNYQWLISDYKHSEIQDPEDVTIDSSSREDFSIRNYTVSTDSGGFMYLTSGDVYRTLSSYGSISDSDVVIGTVVGTAPSAHAHIEYTVTTTRSSDTVSGHLEIVHGESRSTVQRLLHKSIITAVNNHASFNQGIEWTYDAADDRINTHQPFLDMFDVTFTINNTDGQGGLGTKTIELVSTTALLSSGLSEEERTALFEATSLDDLATLKADLLADTSPLAKQDVVLDIQDKVNRPWLD
ncbi:hypothetical protein GR7B_00188 [Vibrio phage vB_VcorM_GR7B]|nr:hypothetical protein GR7B_00188 [Vibrio phage vB_VcorM_GR7B]